MTPKKYLEFAAVSDVHCLSQRNYVEMEVAVCSQRYRSDASMLFPMGSDFTRRGFTNSLVAGLLYNQELMAWSH